VSRSGYYAWRARLPSRRSRANQALLSEIRRLHQGVYRVYGSPRLHQELVARGFACSPNRVARLMRAHQIRAQAGQHGRRAVTQTASTWVAPNVLAGRFQATRLNQFWLADITYVWTQTGWLYLAVVMDLCSRRIIGWSMSAQPTAQLALNALQMALQHRQPRPQTVLHHFPIRGVQYACQAYQECLQAHQIQASMSRRGVCYDNAVIESFFRSLKTERVRSQSYPSQAAARRDLFKYVEIFYNRKRRHSTLGYVSPAEFEATLLKESLLSVSNLIGGTSGRRYSQN
jgi:transposase InsO family protein